MSQSLGIINCALLSLTSCQSALWTLPCLSYCSSYSFFQFISFFPRGETWNSFISLTATNPLVCAWSPANDLKQWKQDLWKKSFLPHLSMLQELLRPGEKRKFSVQKKSIHASVLTSGTELAEVCVIFLLTGKL